MNRQSRSLPLFGSAVIAALALIMFVVQVKAVDDNGKNEEEVRRELRLKNMKLSAAQYTVSPVDRKREFKFHETPTIRFSNPVGGTKDGALYVWSDRGRPRAVVKFYTYDNERFSHEWQSLSEAPLVAVRDGSVIWNPTDPGLTFREFPDAPRPAETAAERLRQMKSLAAKFSSTYTHIPGESKPVDLRLLVQPLFRYEASDDHRHLDGALFTFANGTAPHCLFLLEARRTGENDLWHYAFARMGSGAMDAHFGEKEVFSVARYDHRFDPKQTFLQLNRQSVPKE